MQLACIWTELSAVAIEERTKAHMFRRVHLRFFMVTATFLPFLALLYLALFLVLFLARLGHKHIVVVVHHRASYQLSGEYGVLCERERTSQQRRRLATVHHVPSLCWQQEGPSGVWGPTVLEGQ